MILMYELHYNYIKKKYGGKAQLLFTDTDSLCYEIRTEDFYKDIANDVPKWFDTSANPKSHPGGIPTGVNKKVIGMFKDEFNGEQILEFAGVRAKCYAVRYKDSEDKKCKGVKKAVVKGHITFEDYKNCVLNRTQKFVTQNVFSSRAHNVFREKVHKEALCAKDDKRVILEDGINMLPIGHFRHVTGLENNSFDAIKVFKTNVTRNQLNGKHNTKIKHCPWVADRRVTRRSVI